MAKKGAGRYEADHRERKKARRHDKKIKKKNLNLLRLAEKSARKMNDNWTKHNVMIHGHTTTQKNRIGKS